MPKKKVNSQSLIVNRKSEKDNDSQFTINNTPEKWYLFDARGEILGRLAVKIAKILQGKHKPNFVPYRNLADNVVVVNADKIQVTGKKEKQKTYTFYSGYPSGLKKLKLTEIRNKKPEFLIKHAVSGMLPKNKLTKVRLKKLHVFSGTDHPYESKFKI